MTSRACTALIADDEPLLREALERMLLQVWPELKIVARARNGREAIELFDQHRPDVCFLDVQMPGKTGLETAEHIGRRAHLVFVTAFDQYAVQAFSQGVLDYLVKPVELSRLVETVTRLQERVRASTPALNTEALIQQLAASLQSRASAAPLQWLKASVGQTVRLIAIDDVEYFRSEDKYTLVAWQDDQQKPREAILRMTLKELLPQLDTARFVQVHRSVVVNLQAIDHVVRNANETADIHLKRRPEVLPVSRSYLSVFKQM
jgi:DNA-binding LytR/AlgR family response regulator